MQQKVLREVLAGIGASDFTEVEVQRPEPAWGPSTADSVALVVPHNVDDLRQEWLSWLLAQAFAQRSHELGLPPVSYLAPRRGGVDAEGLHSTPQAPERMTLSDARRAAERARRAATLDGGEIDRIEILRPHGYAFLVEMRVKDDPARFLWEGLPKVLSAIGGPQPIDGHYAGDYTLVVDGNGNRLWEGAEANLGEGSIQVGGVDRADLRGCSPFFVGGPAESKPPPCPVKSAAEPSDQGSPSDVTTRIVGATPKQESILREILGGFGQTVLEQVRVSPADADWTPIHPNSVVVHIDFTKAEKNGRGYWEAALLAEAFDRRSRALHLQPVAAYETPTQGTALDGPDEPKRPERKPVTPDELKSKAAAAAKASGADLVELRVVRPQHLAVAITLRVDKPAEYLKHHLLTFLEAIPNPSDREYDGLYVLVVDHKGKFVWLRAWTVSDTISGGGGGTRPDLAGCDPGPGFGSTIYSPPPCPAD